jgi:hypothetical protein
MMKYLEVKDTGNQAHAVQMHTNGSTKTFAPGMYMIHIKGVNKKVETFKFTIIH